MIICLTIVYQTEKNQKVFITRKARIVHQMTEKNIEKCRKWNKK